MASMKYNNLILICSRCCSTTAKSQFGHHAPGVARLNHGSFGSVPSTVLKYQDEIRRSWLAQPDEWYFTGKLNQKQKEAARSTIPHLTRDDASSISDDQICFVENATVATVAIARRWSKIIKPDDVIIVLSVGYKASLNVLREYCESVGAKLEVLKIPFPPTSPNEIIEHVKGQLRNLPKKPRFALLDHISSQPAILLPTAELSELVRRYGESDIEVAVDGAHSIGSTIFDVKELGCDWFFSNLHKWGFTPAASTIMYAANPALMKATIHPITSWTWGQGLAVESQFPGTRDFSSILTSPAAMEFLSSWRSCSGETAISYSHRRVLESASYLANLWGTKEYSSLNPDLIATQAMVRLPLNLRVEDVPGRPGIGIRAMLRNDYNVEAAIGNFGPELGSYVRLSYGIYNTQKDIEMLENGVLDILKRQQEK